MFDLKQYHRTIELEAQVASLQEDLRLQKKLTSKYKTEWRTAIGEYETPTDKARKLVKAAGEVSNVSAECRRIAKEAGLKACTVRALWYAKT